MCDWGADGRPVRVFLLLRVSVILCLLTPVTRRYCHSSSPRSGPSCVFPRCRGLHFRSICGGIMQHAKRSSLLPTASISGYSMILLFLITAICFVQIAWLEARPKGWEGNFIFHITRDIPLSLLRTCHFNARPWPVFDTTTTMHCFSHLSEFLPVAPPSDCTHNAANQELKKKNWLLKSVFNKGLYCSLYRVSWQHAWHLIHVKKKNTKSNWFEFLQWRARHSSRCWRRVETGGLESRSKRQPAEPQFLQQVALGCVSLPSV